MKEKTQKHTTAQLACVIVFAAVILAFFALLLFLPKNYTELDSLEFRMLAQNPLKGLSGDAFGRQLVRGELSENVDSYLEDHFPARSFFIAVDSYYSRLTGRNAVQRVVLGKNGRMYDAPADLNKKQIDGNAADINEFAAQYGLKAYLVLAPGSGLAVQSELPAVHPVYRDAEIIESFNNASTAECIDLAAFYSAAVKANAVTESELYYRTDHHWTMTGAYLCYCRLCQSMGLDPVPQTVFAVEGCEFYGSYYRKSGAWLTAPDTLEVWRSSALDNAEVIIGAGESAVTHTGVYDESKLAEGEMDKYAAYVYGNNAVTVINNPRGNGRSLMIVKDSYGNSLAPFFAESFSTVVLIDTRYYPAPVDPGELVEQYGITELIVVMGLDTATTPAGFAYLR